MKLFVNAVGIVMGGGQRHLAPFLTGLAEARPSWTVAVSVDERLADLGGIPPGVEVCKVPIANATGRLRWDAFGVATLAEGCGASCVVNVANAGPWAPRLPSIVYQRNPVYFDPAWVAGLSRRHRYLAGARRALVFRAAAGAYATVTPSAAMAGFLRAWPSWRNAWPAVSIPHAVDGTRFAFRPRPFRLDRPFNLTAVGHPALHKGLDTVVRALAELRSRGFDASARFTLSRSGHSADDQRYVDGLVTLARRLAVGDHVHLVSPRADVEAVYADTSVLAFPSLTESFGFPLIEAMASGVPIVASAIPSSIELLGAQGNYFAPGNHLGLAGVVLRMGSAAAPVQQQLLADARRHAEQQNWRANAESLATLVEAATSQ